VLERRESGNFLCGRNLNSPVFYVVCNTYVTMSYVVFSSLGNDTAKRGLAIREERLR